MLFIELSLLRKEFIETKEFEKNWLSLGFADEDLFKLQNLIVSNKNSSTIIKGSGGLRKIRYSLPSKGKSSGARVCYLDFENTGKVVLVTVYSKHKKDNLSDSEINLLYLFVEKLKKYYGGTNND